MISKVAKNLILNAIKIHGHNIKRIMSYIDEKATDNVKEVEKFLTWSFTNRGYLGYGNFDVCLKDFMNQN